jgi:hypothetical protein
MNINSISPVGCRSCNRLPIHHIWEDTHPKMHSFNCMKICEKGTAAHYDIKDAILEWNENNILLLKCINCDEYPYFLIKYSWYDLSTPFHFYKCDGCNVETHHYINKAFAKQQWNELQLTVLKCRFCDSTPYLDSNLKGYRLNCNNCWVIMQNCDEYKEAVEIWNVIMRKI